MIEVRPETEGNLLVIRATKKLTNQDYKDVMIPRLEAIIREYGRARFVMDLSHDFDGWDVSAMWDDVRFGVSHRNSFERMAIVGGPKCAEWGTKLVKLMMNGELRYFPPEKYNEACDWVNEYSNVETGVADCTCGGHGTCTACQAKYAKEHSNVKTGVADCTCGGQGTCPACHAKYDSELVGSHAGN